MIVCSPGRATAFFKMGIGRHGFGVPDKAVPIDHSHGLFAGCKTVAPHFEQSDGPRLPGGGVWRIQIHQRRTHP